jgi:tellurite resistance protein TerC
MRGAFIAAGAFLLTRFGWVQYVMGAILVLAAVRMPRRDAGLSLDRNPVLRVLGRILPLRSTLHGSQMLVRDPDRGGRWSATPLFVALILVELSDVAFAIDSIPAIFSITRDPFLVYTSNVLAVLGLRSLYFVLAAAVRRFRFLPHGVAVILAFVGLKMLLTSVVAIPTGLVLLVVVVVLTVAVAASMSRLGRPDATDS